MKEKATYGNQHTGKMRWGRAVVCAVAGCFVFGLSADVGAEARIPIVGWAGLSQDKASAERYAEAKDAGFTHLTQWCKTPSDAGRLLAEAEKAGVKLIIGFGGRDIKRMTDEAEAFTTVAKGSPALEYYFIADEPHIEKAGDLRDCIARYEALDPAHPCYVNLLGSGWDPETRDDRRRTRGNTGCETYGEYLESLFKTAPLKMVSFDVYPVCAAKPLGNADHRLHGARAILNDRWYETLETASAFARKRGLPMFAFALSTAHGHFPGNEYVAPSIRHFRLQMYSNLAYGAQALQYFRYWAGGIAPVLVDGKRSPVFELVREMNQELQARAFVFKGAKVRKVWHTGVTIPIGTKRLDPKALPPFVTSFTADKRATLAVSWLKNGNTDYLVVLNRDPNDDTDFAATFDPRVRLVRRDGTLADAGSYANFFWLEPGDVAIFAAPRQLARMKLIEKKGRHP